jgi:hypothetical protein
MDVVPPRPLPPAVQTLTTNKVDDAFDIKSEAATTPLTTLTSRHSLPSDDTVIVAEAINGKQPQGPDNASPVGDAPDRTKGNREATVLADEDADADADTDEDLDAEGEIDAEGDLDVEVVF